MVFDAEKCRMTSEERAEAVRERAAGKANRQKCVDSFLEVMTCEGTPFDANQLRELRSTLYYLCDDARPFIDTICRRFSEPKEAEIKRAVLLAIIVECANRLIE
jgi:hypothetical protein